MDTLPLVSPDQVGLSAARLSRISSWMKGWVDSGRLPGMVGLRHAQGRARLRRDLRPRRRRAQQADAADTIFRIYSMTKPLTSTAIMMLYEEGPLSARQSDLPLHPGLQEPARLCRRQPRQDRNVPAEREITFRDLLTHTSGLTYGFMESNPVDALYRSRTASISRPRPRASRTSSRSSRPSR
jgi:CubicO group peptidase (beta-lactamase class C family)